MSIAPHKDRRARFRSSLGLVRGHGCLDAGGLLLLARPEGASCVHRDPPRGPAPLPLEMPGVVDAALEAAESPVRWVVVGADGDPLLTRGAWGDAMLAAAARVVEHGVGLWLVTRGAPLDGAWSRLLRQAAAAGGARLELGLFSLDPSLTALYEPGAADPDDRLLAARRALSAGVHVRARVSPLLPWICDTPDVFETISARLSQAGIREVHTTYLYLDGGDQRRLGKLPPAHRALLRSLLRESPHREGEAWLLPRGLRAEGYRRFARAAARHGLSVHVCRSANPDLEVATRCFVPSKPRGLRPAVRPKVIEIAPSRVKREDEGARDVARPARPPRRRTRRPRHRAGSGQLDLFEE